MTSCLQGSPREKLTVIGMSCYFVHACLDSINFSLPDFAQFLLPFDLKLSMKDWISAIDNGGGNLEVFRSLGLLEDTTCGIVDYLHYALRWVKYFDPRDVSARKIHPCKGPNKYALHTFYKTTRSIQYSI